MSVSTKEPELEDQLQDDEDVEDVEDGDESEDEGWLLVYADGRQEVVDHPDGLDPKEVLESFESSIKKGHAFFRLGSKFIMMHGLWSFGWSEDSHFPEIDVFDSLREKYEFLSEGLNELLQQQAALQQAQAMLFQSEMEEMQAELIQQAQAAQRPARVAQAPKTQPSQEQPQGSGGKKKFRPPTA